MLETLQATWTQPKDSVGWGKKQFIRSKNWISCEFYGNPMGIYGGFIGYDVDLMGFEV